jgi:hypothetical protein
VPLLADFHPNSISTLTHHSDSVLLFTDKAIWHELNPGRMPNLRAAIDVKEGTMLWHRDDRVAQAWQNREKAFAEKFTATYPGKTGRKTGFVVMSRSPRAELKSENGQLVFK